MKPILFNTEMVKAILDGRKTSFRFPIKLKDNSLICTGYIFSSTDRKRNDCYSFGKNKEHDLEYIKPKYKIDDILYVKETWCYGSVVADEDNGNIECWLEQLESDIDNEKIFYKADMEDAVKEGVSFEDVVWKPSIHMPKKYARIFLKVTNVRVERLQDIYDKDCIKEGVRELGNCIPPNYDINAKQYYINNSFYKTKKDAFKGLWNSIAKDGYRWEDNPYVFVYEFERVKLGEVK